MSVVSCPGCGVKIRIPEGKHGRFNCPKCSKPLAIKNPHAAGDAISGTTSPSWSQSPPPSQFDLGQFPTTTSQQPLDRLVTSFPVHAAAGPSAAWGSPTAAGLKRSGVKGTTAPLQEFLKPLGIGLGVFSAVLLALAVGGLFSEPVALAACFVGISGTLVLLIWARIWVIVMASQETVTQGVLVLLVPYYWIVFIATRKGRALRPLAVMGGSLIPLLICGVMLAVFLPKYERGAGSSGGRRPGLSQMNLAKLESQIQESYAQAPQELQTVTYNTFDQAGKSIDPLNAEQVLSELSGYVPNSFRYDVRGRKLSFQYRGARDMGPRFGLYLAGKAGIIMDVTPTFSDGPLPPQEALAAVSPPSFAAPVAAMPKPQIAAPQGADDLNALRTISFPALVQGTVDQAAIERALALVNGYVQGSFRFDPQNQLVTLQYRGPEASAIQFGFALQRAQLMVRLKPTFVE